MPNSLSLSDDLALPVDVVTQRLAFIGRPGSGKTFAAKKLFELLVKAGVQAVPIDVVGVWYGVRLAPDGKGPGLAVPILGGLHGDVPLEPGAGALIADLVVDRALTCVLDISQMVDHEQTKFATDFGRRFFERKKRSPSPVHLFLEECQELVPQFPMKDETVKLHVFQRIAKLGRNYGIGLSLISQRPQDVSKKVFNLTELMLAFQLTAPAERRTMRDWMTETGVEDDLNAILPKLKVGQARVWSPAWLEIQKTIQIARIETYDSSATPKVGAKRVEPKALTPIDLEQITLAMRDVVERAKADDPKALRARIAELERQVKAAPKAAATPAKETVIEVPVLDRQLVAGLRSQLADLRALADDVTESSLQSTKAAQSIKATLVTVQRRLDEAEKKAGPSRPPALAGTLGSGYSMTKKSAIETYGGRNQPPAPRIHTNRDSVNPPGQPPSVATGEAGQFKLTPVFQRILDALAWLESIGIHEATKIQAGLVADLSPTGGSYTNNLGSLRTAGLVDYPAPGRLTLTAAGRAQASAPTSAPTAEELQARVKARIGPTKARILQVLIDCYPEPMSKAELAERAGMAGSGGSYTNQLGALRSLGVIDYPTPGQAVALPVLFLE